MKPEEIYEDRPQERIESPKDLDTYLEQRKTELLQNIAEEERKAEEISLDDRRYLAFIYADMTFKRELPPEVRERIWERYCTETPIGNRWMDLDYNIKDLPQGMFSDWETIKEGLGIDIDWDPQYIGKTAGWYNYETHKIGINKGKPNMDTYVLMTKTTPTTLSTLGHELDHVTHLKRTIPTIPRTKMGRKWEVNDGLLQTRDELLEYIAQEKDRGGYTEDPVKTPESHSDVIFKQEMQLERDPLYLLMAELLAYTSEAEVGGEVFQRGAVTEHLWKRAESYPWIQEIDKYTAKKFEDYVATISYLGIPTAHLGPMLRTIIIEERSSESIQKKRYDVDNSKLKASYIQGILEDTLSHRMNLSEYVNPAKIFNADFFDKVYELRSLDRQLTQQKTSRIVYEETTRYVLEKADSLILVHEDIDVEDSKDGKKHSYRSYAIPLETISKGQNSSGFIVYLAFDESDRGTETRLALRYRILDQPEDQRPFLRNTEKTVPRETIEDDLRVKLKEDLNALVINSQDPYLASVAKRNPKGIIIN